MTRWTNLWISFSSTVYFECQGCYIGHGTVNGVRLAGIGVWVFVNDVLPILGYPSVKMC